MVKENPNSQSDSHGRHIRALDLADRLMPDLNPNEALFWPPDLFALTSYILTVTSAYQLVVSPPSGKQWQPPKEELKSWLYEGAEAQLSNWFESITKDWQVEDITPSFEEHLNNIKHWAELDIINPARDLSWDDLVKQAANEWKDNLEHLGKDVLVGLLFRKTRLLPASKRKRNQVRPDEAQKQEHQTLLKTILANTPSLLLACWAFFYNETTTENFSGTGDVLRVSHLLCNQDELQINSPYCDRLWKVSQALLTLHAIADLASLEFGIQANPDNDASRLAEELLFGENGREGGSLSSLNTERCRVLPKRHNPDIGITLRSISSNLAFHQSSVDVVWRKTRGNALGDKLKRNEKLENLKLSILLLPFPLTVNAKDFREDDSSGKPVVNMPPDQYRFFTYEPCAKDGDKGSNDQIKRALKLVKYANRELAEDFDVDIIVLPEAALSLAEFEKLQQGLQQSPGKVPPPSIIIAGVRESKEEFAAQMTNLGIPRSSEQFNFARNAVYCQYYDSDNGGTNGNYYSESELEAPPITPKYKQYKHHRWQLDRTQIRRYGLSSILRPDLTWWESIKIPKRRVSFLNVGDRMTISHLICEDLARQDPIAELVRQVGPTLVVSILMDGPQLKNRWSARYATVLSDDPGSSVITLTSLGMVKRHTSEYGAMSRVIALWNESGAGHSREIELAQGAEAVLLTLKMDQYPEKTADGRQEHVPTSILRLNDVIQIYSTEQSN
jgi:hypothetical protein